MRKLVLLIAGLALIAGASACLAQEYPVAFYPTYWITGTVNNAPDGTSANGRNVYFFHSIPEYTSGFWSTDLAGASGISGRPNRFMVSGFSFGINSLALSGTYYAGIPNDNPGNPLEGYGADPVPVVVSGYGVDETPALNLVKGGGAMLPPPGGAAREPAPNIKVWFGKRLYQPAIYGTKEDSKKPFIVPEKGTIKLEVDILDPFQLNEARSYALKVQTPLGETKSFDLASLASVRASAAGIKPLVIESDYPEELKAAAAAEETVFTFTFFASSRGNLGPATETSTQAAVTVMGGPLRLIGTPLTYPSPVHLKTDKEAFFQYTLSRNGNIDIFVFDISARVVKKFSLTSGEEGGSAGVDKVRWNLITDQGSPVSSGIYVFSMVDRDSGKLLGKGKFTALP